VWVQRLAKDAEIELAGRSEDAVALLVRLAPA
jgi:hypothetical protein